MTKKTFPTHLTEPMEKQTDIEKIKAGRGCFNFDGALIEKIIGAWRFQGRDYLTPELLLDAVKSSRNDLEQSIHRPKITVKASNGSFTAINSENGIWLAKMK